MSSPGFQIECRCRLRGLLGQTLHWMPRRARSRAVAALLASAAEGVDLDHLLASREALRACGVLLNQSLRFSHLGGGPDVTLVHRIEVALGIIEALTKGEEVSP